MLSCILDACEGWLHSYANRVEEAHSLDRDSFAVALLAGGLINVHKNTSCLSQKEFRRDYYIGARNGIDARRSNHERSSTRITSLPPSGYIEMRIRSCAMER